MKENLGQSNARNYAIKQAKGKYIAIHDSDDLSFPKRIEIEVQYLESHPDIDIVSSSFRIVYEDGLTHNLKFPLLLDKLVRFMVLFKNPIAHSSVMVRMNEEMRSRYVYDPRAIYFADKDLFLRLLYPKEHSVRPI